MEKYRDRKFCLLLYPEDASHKACVEKLIQGGYDCAVVLHNQDIWTELDPAYDPEKHTIGEKKKEHWHIVLKFQNPRWNTALADELGIKPNYLEKCTNLDSALLYLVHEGYPEKYQYDIESVQGSLKVNLQKLLLDEDEGSRVLRIVEIIDNSPSPTYREILIKACKAGLYGEFRRLGSGVKYLLDERRDEEARERQHNAGVTISREAFEEYLAWTGSKGLDKLPPL